MSRDISKWDWTGTYSYTLALKNSFQPAFSTGEGIIYDWSVAHDVPPEVHKFSALQRLGHEVSPHLVGGTKFNFKILLFHLIGKEEELDVQHARPFASTLSAIDFE